MTLKELSNELRIRVCSDYANKTDPAEIDASILKMLEDDVELHFPGMVPAAELRALAPVSDAEDDYVAWLCWVGDEEHRRMKLCDSDTPGAFKVYRSRMAPFPLQEAAREVVKEMRALFSECPVCSREDADCRKDCVIGKLDAAEKALALEAGKQWNALSGERDALKVQVEQLRNVCAEAYQMAGALGGPEKALDNFSAAANGTSIPHETFLPVIPVALNQIAALNEQLSREKGKNVPALRFGAVLHRRRCSPATGLNALKAQLDSFATALKSISARCNDCTIRFRCEACENAYALLADYASGKPATDVAVPDILSSSSFASRIRSAGCPENMAVKMVEDRDAQFSARISAIESDVEQLRVQLAGCDVAALGGTQDPAVEGQWGWSPAYQSVLDLRRKYESQLGWLRRFALALGPLEALAKSFKASLTMIA